MKKYNKYCIGLFCFFVWGGVSFAQCDYSFFSAENRYICPVEIVNDSLGIDVFLGKLNVPKSVVPLLYTDTVNKELLADVVSFPEHGWYDTAYVFVTLEMAGCESKSSFIPVKFVKANDQKLFVEAPSFANSGDTIVLKPSFAFDTYMFSDSVPVGYIEKSDSLISFVPAVLSGGFVAYFAYSGEKSGCSYTFSRHIQLVDYILPQKPAIAANYIVCAETKYIVFDKQYVFYSDYSLLDLLYETDSLDISECKPGKHLLYVCEKSGDGLSNPQLITINKKHPIASPYIYGNKEICENDTLQINTISDSTVWLDRENMIVALGKSIDSVMPKGTYVFGAYVSDAGCLSDTSFYSVVVKPLPSVQFDDIYTCVNNSPLLLSDVFENSYDFSGKGVTFDTLFVSQAGIGRHEIAFMHETQGCVIPASAFVDVGQCEILRKLEVNFITDNHYDSVVVKLYSSNNLGVQFDDSAIFDSLNKAVLRTTLNEVYLVVEADNAAGVQEIFYYGNSLENSYPVLLNNEHVVVEFYDEYYPTTVDISDSGTRKIIYAIYDINGNLLYNDALIEEVRQGLGKGIFILKDKNTEKTKLICNLPAGLD